MEQYDGLIPESPYTKAYGVNVGTNVPRKNDTITFNATRKEVTPEPTEPTVTNNITDSTEQHTYQDGTLSITVTASEGYTFQDAKASYHTSAGMTEPVTPTVTNNIDGTEESHEWDGETLTITVNPVLY